MSTTIRLIILTVAVVSIWNIALMLRGTLSTESLPDWRLNEFPEDLRLDAPDGSVISWHGKKQAVDPILAQAVDADEISDRAYSDNAGNSISIHMAAFKQYQYGVTHNPMVCYDRGGWELKDDSILDLDVADNEDGKKDEERIISVKVSAWEHKEKGRAMIAYWYQLGDDLVFDRVSLGTSRMKYLGQPFKPALMKFLLHTNYTTSAEKELARERLKAMCESVYDWINQPGHDWIPKKKPQ